METLQRLRAGYAAEPVERTRRWFLVAIALVHLASFASLAVQIEGLVGSEGILPFADELEAHRAAAGVAAYLAQPTLLWLWPTDAALWLICALGIGLSVLGTIGVAPRWVFAGLFTLHLSLVQVGSVFLLYQWDALLAEASALAWLVAPPSARGRGRFDVEVPRGAIWLLRFLLFRLVFFSGYAKLVAGGPVWTDLRALDYHYFTQPLPNPVAYFAHQLPASFQSLGVAMVFALELAGPLLVFGPRPLRLCAFFGSVALQLGIAATGNFGFFNALSLALCIPLLDDHALAAVLPRRPERAEPAAREPLLARRLVATLSVGMFALALLSLLRAVPAPLAPFLLANRYALFVSMTTERNEIEIEGSADGTSWRTYVFRYKPGPLDRSPPLAWLHMPRLDWQMWFAALSDDCRTQPWYPRLLARLLEGAKPVEGLFERVPFDEDPPRYLRSRFYRYTFSEPGGADWWSRTELRAYCPTVVLEDGELRIADLPP